jgi:3-oxoacyl-[acyl-carrier protein] reductase
VANAGIVRGGSVLTMEQARWDEIMDVNMKGTFLTVRACSREMVRLNRTGPGGGGRIITISSANAVLAGAEAGAYCATKAGVAIMTRCWAQDLIAHDITVNCIGPVHTHTHNPRAPLPYPRNTIGNANATQPAMQQAH